MANYRKKPVVIEAFKLGVDYIPDWFMDAVTANEVILHGTSSGFNHIADTNADIHTLEGWHHANYGDYIIRGVKGEIYPCKSDIFEMTYEAADKPMTNTDRIRAMTDEELAEWMAECNAYGERADASQWLPWLKQPCEEENNHENS